MNQEISKSRIELVLQGFINYRESVDEEEAWTIVPPSSYWTLSNIIYSPEWVERLNKLALAVLMEYISVKLDENASALCKWLYQQMKPTDFLRIRFPLITILCELNAKKIELEINELRFSELFEKFLLIHYRFTNNRKASNLREVLDIMEAQTLSDFKAEWNGLLITIEDNIQDQEFWAAVSRSLEFMDFRVITLVLEHFKELQELCSEINNSFIEHIIWRFYIKEIEQIVRLEKKISFLLYGCALLVRRFVAHSELWSNLDSDDKESWWQSYLSTLRSSKELLLHIQARYDEYKQWSWRELLFPDEATVFADMNEIDQELSSINIVKLRQLLIRKYDG